MYFSFLQKKNKFYLNVMNFCSKILVLSFVYLNRFLFFKKICLQKSFGNSIYKFAYKWNVL